MIGSQDSILDLINFLKLSSSQLFLAGGYKKSAIVPRHAELGLGVKAWQTINPLLSPRTTDCISTSRLAFALHRKMDLSLFCQNNLLYTQESLSRYQPGGYHPVHLGDTFDNGRYTVYHKLGWGGYSTVWLANDRVSAYPPPA